mgnify:CR=1 FL=1
MTIGSILDQQPDKLKGLQKILLMAFCISPFLSTRHTIMAERDYLPLILFTAILSTLCTFARDIIDYQLIALCRQSQKASALRLHPSAPICTDTIPHTPHDKTGVPPAHYGIGGANFLSEQQIFLPPYTFFSDWHK